MLALQHAKIFMAEAPSEHWFLPKNPAMAVVISNDDAAIQHKRVRHDRMHNKRAHENDLTRWQFHSKPALIYSIVWLDGMVPWQMMIKILLMHLSPKLSHLNQARA